MRVCLAALLLLLVGCRAQCSAYLTCSDCYTSNGTFSCSWNPNTQTCVPPDPLDKSLMTSSQDCMLLYSRRFLLAQVHAISTAIPTALGPAPAAARAFMALSPARAFGMTMSSPLRISRTLRCSKICRSTKVGTCQSTTNDCFNLTPGVKDAFKLASWIIAIIIITVILIIAVFAPLALALSPSAHLVRQAHHHCGHLLRVLRCWCRRRGQQQLLQTGSRTCRQ